jgi:hypothetical protein
MDLMVGFEPTTPALYLPFCFDLVIDLFCDWLVSQNKTKATIRETINYARRFASVLDTGDASPLLTLSPRNKQHAMSALANLAKFTGRYQKFVQIRQNYNLKWSKGDSVQSFHRFFNEELSFDKMLQRIREMIAKTLSGWAKYYNSPYLLGSDLQKCANL